MHQFAQAEGYRQRQTSVTMRLTPSPSQMVQKSRRQSRNVWNWFKDPPTPGYAVTSHETSSFLIYQANSDINLDLDCPSTDACDFELLALFSLGTVTPEEAHLAYALTGSSVKEELRLGTDTLS